MILDVPRRAVLTHLPDALQIRLAVRQHLREAGRGVTEMTTAATTTVRNVVASEAFRRTSGLRARGAAAAILPRSIPGEPASLPSTIRKREGQRLHVRPRFRTHVEAQRVLRFARIAFVKRLRDLAEDERPDVRARNRPEAVRPFRQRMLVDPTSP